MASRDNEHITLLLKEIKEYRELKYHIGAMYKYTLGTVIEMRKNHDYRVEFTACGQPMLLDVIIGSEYPRARPTIFLSPRPRHPWMHARTNQVVHSPSLKFYQYWRYGSNYFILAQVIEEIILEMKQFYLRTIPLREAVTTEDLCFLPICSSNLDCFNKYTLPEVTEIFKNNGIFKRVNEVPHSKFDEYNSRVVMVTNKIEKLLKNGKVTGLKKTIFKSLMAQMQDSLEEDINCRKHYENYQDLVELYDESVIRKFFHEAALRDHADYNVIARGFLCGEVTAEMFTLMFRNMEMMITFPLKEYEHLHAYDPESERSRKCLQM